MLRAFGNALNLPGVQHTHTICFVAVVAFLPSGMSSQTQAGYKSHKSLRASRLRAYNQLA